MRGEDIKIEESSTIGIYRDPKYIGLRLIARVIQLSQQLGIKSKNILC